MTCSFLDGPLEGCSISLHRAPHFLRAVRDSTGKVDALDQPDDSPTDDETISVYVMEAGSWSQVFVRPGGCYESGRYHHLLLPAALVETFADRQVWSHWVTEHGNEAATAAGLDPWHASQ